MMIEIVLTQQINLGRNDIFTILSFLIHERVNCFLNLTISKFIFYRTLTPL